MSDQPGINKEHFFSMEPEHKLKIGSELTFDCFVYLDLNQKIVHWLRAGAKFTEQHQKKMEKFAGREMLVFKFQENLYRSYMGLPPRAKPPPALETPSKPKASAQNDVFKVFGKIKIDDKPLHLRGGAVQEKAEPIHIKGSANAAEQKPTTAVAPKLKVDAEFLNAVIVAAQRAFSDICGIQVTSRAPTKRDVEGSGAVQADIAAFVSLSSKSIRGTIGLCFPEKTFFALVAQTTGQDIVEMTPEAQAGCGELIYSIYEQAVPDLNAQGYTLDAAVPIFVAGHKLSIPSIMPDPGFSLVFDCEHGPFVLEIGIKTGG